VLVEAGVRVSSLLGTAILVAVLVRLLVAFFNWRRSLRTGVGSNGRASVINLRRHDSSGCLESAKIGVGRLATDVLHDR